MAAPQNDNLSPTDEQPLVEISNLEICFHTENGVLKAVDGLNLQILRGETLGLVGESGCGKSVTAFSMLQLLPSPPARVSGSIRFEGRELLSLTDEEMRSVRGRRISMIFQEPMSSLNPIMTIGRQITEVILEHQKKSRKEARHLTIDMLGRVGLPSPEARFDEYPHQMSGGMKQRAMIAMALACRPQLLIADEPTTALDVTIQAQILDLLSELQSEFGMSVLLITHDLGIVAETCDRVAVMYAGKIAEQAEVKDLFEHPLHPYTRGLFRSLPSLAAGSRMLETIPGSVPSPLDFPSGCRFRPRCPMAEDICKQEPPLREVREGHLAACHFAEEDGGQST
ncbi:MAG TPA: ABC transporter ATP-binding protein [Blastocatellia bacterium]